MLRSGHRRQTVAMLAARLITGYSYLPTTRPARSALIFSYTSPSPTPVQGLRRRAPLARHDCDLSGGQTTS
jgi:hypothetical protein